MLPTSTEAAQERLDLLRVEADALLRVPANAVAEAHVLKEDLALAGAVQAYAHFDAPLRLVATTLELGSVNHAAGHGFDPSIVCRVHETFVRLANT